MAHLGQADSGGAIVQRPTQRILSIDQRQTIRTEMLARPAVVVVAPTASGSALSTRVPDGAQVQGQGNKGWSSDGRLGLRDGSPARLWMRGRLSLPQLAASWEGCVRKSRISIRRPSHSFGFAPRLDLDVTGNDGSRVLLGRKGEVKSPTRLPF